MLGNPEAKGNGENLAVPTPPEETPHRSRVSMLAKIGVGLATGVATFISPEVVAFNIIRWGVMGGFAGILVPTISPLTLQRLQHYEVGDQYRYFVRSAAFGVKVGALAGAAIATKVLIFG